MLATSLILIALVAAGCSGAQHARTGDAGQSQPAEALVRAYERAAARERKQAELVERLVVLSLLATDTIEMVEEDAREVRDAADEAEERLRVIEQLSTDASDAAKSGNNALVAVERLRISSDDARAAATAYGAAQVSNRFACAKRADGLSSIQTSSQPTNSGSKLLLS